MALFRRKSTNENMIDWIHLWVAFFDLVNGRLFLFFLFCPSCFFFCVLMLTRKRRKKNTTEARHEKISLIKMIWHMTLSEHSWKCSLFNSKFIVQECDENERIEINVFSCLHIAQGKDREKQGLCQILDDLSWHFQRKISSKEWWRISEWWWSPNMSTDQTIQWLKRWNSKINKNSRIMIIQTISLLILYLAYGAC